jgi:hypothetical protein
LIYFHEDRDELSSEGSATLRTLMEVETVDLSQERLDFLA